MSVAVSSPPLFRDRRLAFGRCLDVDAHLFRGRVVLLLLGEDDAEQVIDARVPVFFVHLRGFARVLLGDVHLLQVVVGHRADEVGAGAGPDVGGIIVTMDWMTASALRAR